MRRTTQHRRGHALALVAVLDRRRSIGSPGGMGGSADAGGTGRRGLTGLVVALIGGRLAGVHYLRVGEGLARKMLLAQVRKHWVRYGVSIQVSVLGASLCMGMSVASALPVRAKTPPSGLQAQRLAVQQASELSTLNVQGNPVNRIYVMDADFHHIIDSRLNLFDLRTGKFLGMVSTGFNAHVHLSKNGHKIYVLTKYFSRLTRGKRTDAVEVYNASTLRFMYEVVVPPKTASVLNYHTLFTLTNNGRFLLIQNATPGLSTSVVDTRSHKFVQEITATAGCWSAIPIPGTPRSFAAICSDGSLMRVNLKDDGRLGSTADSKPFFNPQKDPIFIDPGYLAHGLAFVSFNGNVYVAHVDPDGHFSFAPRWSLLATPAERAERWVPTGFNMVAVNPNSDVMYVLMHPHGKDGSQKEPATEVWVVNLRTHRRLAEVPADGAVSLSLSEVDGTWHLFTIDGQTVRIYTLDQSVPKLARTIKGAAESGIWVMGELGDVRN